VTSLSAWGKPRRYLLNDADLEEGRWCDHAGFTDGLLVFGIFLYNLPILPVSVPTNLLGAVAKLGQ